jgi:hypothetical protein
VSPSTSQAHAEIRRALSGLSKTFAAGCPVG